MNERVTVHEFAETVTSIYACHSLHCKLGPADTECV